jgi:hypothetical protein
MTLAEYVQFRTLFDQRALATPSIGESLDGAYEYAHRLTLNHLGEYEDKFGIKLLPTGDQFLPTEGHRYTRDFLSERFGGRSRSQLKSVNDISDLFRHPIKPEDGPPSVDVSARWFRVEAPDHGYYSLFLGPGPRHNTWKTVRAIFVRAKPEDGILETLRIPALDTIP